MNDSESRWFGYLAGVMTGTHGAYCPTVTQVSDEPYAAVAAHVDIESMPTATGRAGWEGVRGPWWR